MSIDPGWAATICLLGFAVLSLHDALVVHLWRERLPLRPASRIEHRIHTLRAWCFAPILVVFFAGHGPAALAWTLVAIDQGLETADMAVERRSRAHTAGLPTAEYVVHGLIVTLRAAALAFAAISGPAAPLVATAEFLAPGAVLIAVVHEILASRPTWFRRWYPAVPA
jgi:hypothetical protein